MLLTEVQQRLCVLQTLCGICGVGVLEDICCTCQTCCHLAAYRRVVIACCEPVYGSFVGLHLGGRPYAVVCAAVGNNVCNSAYTARAVEECGLHEVIGAPFQLIDEVVLAACLFVYAGIEVVRERKAVQGEADGEVEFYVVACVVETARNVHFSVTVRINEGFE